MAPLLQKKSFVAEATFNENVAEVATRVVL